MSGVGYQPLVSEKKLEHMHYVSLRTPVSGQWSSGSTTNTMAHSGWDENEFVSLSLLDRLVYKLYKLYHLFSNENSF